MHEPQPAEAPYFIEEVIDEARLFVATLLGFLRHPRRFAGDWARGAQRAMNPIAFFGTALGLQLGVKAIVAHFHPDTELAALSALLPTYLWIGDLLSSQIPLASSLIFAFVVHLRLRKSSGVPFRASFGALLFVDGLAYSVRALLQVILFRASGHQLDVASTGIDAISVVFMVLALVGVHRLQRWTQALVPLFLGFVVVVLATALVGFPIFSAMMELAKSRHGNASIKVGSILIYVSSDTVVEGDAGTPTDAGVSADAGLPIDAGARELRR